MGKASLTRSRVRRRPRGRAHTLSPDNGGDSGPDYCLTGPRSGFGGRLPGPFGIGAGIGLPANGPTLWNPATMPTLPDLRLWGYRLLDTLYHRTANLSSACGKRVPQSCHLCSWKTAKGAKNQRTIENLCALCVPCGEFHPTAQVAIRKGQVIAQDPVSRALYLYWQGGQKRV